MQRNSEITGIQKAAILLITLGPEKSANIFKHLKEVEIEQLTLEIANTRSVSAATKEEVMNEFYEICLAQQYIAEGGIGYAKELLEKALGPEKAKDVINKLNETWGTVFWSQTYNTFEEIPLPKPTITTHNPSLRMEHERILKILDQLNNLIQNEK